MPISFGRKNKAKLEFDVTAAPLYPDCLLFTQPSSRLIDVRTAEAFRTGFIPGSFNIPDLDCLAAAERSGLLKDREVYLLAEDQEQLQLLSRADFLAMPGTNLAGWFGADAIDEWKRVKAEAGTLELLNRDTFYLRLAALDMLVIDVLDHGENRTVSHNSALRFCVDELPQNLDGLPAETLICLTARSAGLASFAASLLCNFGFRRVSYLHGGCLLG